MDPDRDSSNPMSPPDVITSTAGETSDNTSAYYSDTSAISIGEKWGTVIASSILHPSLRVKRGKTFVRYRLWCQWVDRMAIMRPYLVHDWAFPCAHFWTRKVPWGPMCFSSSIFYD